MKEITKNIIIREANKNDAPAAYQLIIELAEYEKAAHEVKLSLEQFTQDGFGEQPKYLILIAEKENEVLGMALLHFGYSTWKGKRLFLEDLVVREQYRQLGIGSKLLDAVFDYAKKNNYPQIKWQVLDWNEPAINFYKKYNVDFSGEWLNCMINL